MQHQEWYLERERLLGRIKELEAENAELRKRLGEDVAPIEKAPTAMQNLSLQESRTMPAVHHDTNGPFVILALDGLLCSAKMKGGILYTIPNF